MGRGIMWRKIWGASLWVKLTAAFAFVVVLGALGVVILISFVTSREFEIYVTRDSARWAQWLAPQLAAYYARTHSWDGVEDLVIGAGGMPMMMGTPSPAMERMHREMMGQMPMMQNVDMWTGMGLRVIVADEQGIVRVDTTGEWVGQPLPHSGHDQGTPIRVNDETVGVVLVAPLANSNTPEALFLHSMTRAVLIVSLGMGLVSLVLAAFIARQITAPLRRLATAAYEVARGNLSVRVPVQGEDDLARVSLAFNRMAVALEHQYKLRRQLMNDIAHELRTPLSVIQAQTEALIDGVFPPTPEHIEPIHEQIVLLRRLVNDLRELALAEAGDLQMTWEYLDLAQVIERAVRSMQSSAENKHIHMECELQDTPLWVRGDAQRLEQVVLNLLSNAVRYTPEGGTIRVRGWKQGDQIYCQVEDSGPGIPPEHIPHVFERFWRGDRSRSRETGGTGLGLAIACKWVEAHHGRIWVESPPGRGAIFTFVLPAGSPTSDEKVYPHGREEEDANGK